MLNAVDRNKINSIRWGAAAAFTAPFIIYCLTLAPTVTLEDAGEYISVALNMGLAHPPGAPLWCLIGHLFTWFPFGTIAERTGSLSLLAGSMSCMVLFGWLRRVGLTGTHALAATLTAAFSQCVWSQSVVTEVYTLNLLLFFMVLFMVSIWRETSRPGWLWFAAFLGGLGSANHYLMILLSPIVMIYAGWGRHREIFRPAVAGLSILCILAGLSAYLYLPLRWAQSPPLHWGPVDTVHDLIRYLARRDYTKQGSLWAAGSMQDSIRFTGAFFLNIPRQLGGILAVFILPGMVGMWRQNRMVWYCLAAIILLNGPVLHLMGGPGYSSIQEYISRLYYLPATTAFAAWMIQGWIMFVRLFMNISRFRPAHRAWTLLMFLPPLLLLCMNWSTCDRSDDDLAHEYGLNLLKSMPESSAVMPLTNNEGFVLMYFRFVEKNCKAWLLDRRWGWDGVRQPGHVYSTHNGGQNAIRPKLPYFSGLYTRPETILYRVSRQVTPEGLEKLSAMRDIPYTIRRGPGELGRMTPFEKMIFADYSAYYAGLGVKYWLEKKEDRARRAWSRAEELNPADAYCHYLLADIYQQTGHGSKEIILGHLRRARDVFDDCYCPLDTPCYQVTRELIRLKLDAME
jgi:tetratricopeptide (TPR) repeat protein